MNNSIDIYISPFRSWFSWSFLEPEVHSIFPHSILVAICSPNACIQIPFGQVNLCATELSAETAALVGRELAKTFASWIDVSKDTTLDANVEQRFLRV